MQWHMELLSRNTGCGCHLGALPLPCSNSLVLSIKDLIYPSRALIFASATHRTSPDHLALIASRAYACAPMELYIFTYFKKLMPERLASSQSESRY